jgi:multiple antibiotic resistance protein
MLGLFLDSFVVLFVVVDPVGLAPMFGAITHDAGAEARRRMAWRGTAIAAVLLVVFALAGAALLESLGIGMPAFQIAGGVLLFLVAVDMVFARPHSGIRSTTEREQREAERKDDVSVFPLAFPLIAGPGALTTVLLMSARQAENPWALPVVLIALVLVLAITLWALLQSTRILQIMGETGANVITRVLGVILTALAVQYVLDGMYVAL